MIFFFPGLNPLPKGKDIGWVIPEYLRSRFTLKVGPSEDELHPLLKSLGKTVDVFLHDSDHEYGHVLFEISQAWKYVVPGGLILVDNVEQNEAFFDFAKGVFAEHFVVSSFDTDERQWKTGVMQKPKKEIEHKKYKLHN